MAHKSFSSLNAKRARVEAALLSKANKHYAKAAQLEKQGKPLQARTEATKGRQLAQRAHKAGRYTDGPVGRLPNSYHEPSRGPKKEFEIYSRPGNNKDEQWEFRGYISAPAMHVAIGKWRKAQRPKFFGHVTAKEIKPNPKRADLSWEEAERLGILKRAGVKKPETQAQPRMFAVTWHSSLKNKRVGFIRPIAADTKSEAITIAKTMIDNDPKAKAFVAREIKRNGIVDIAAGMQALDYLGRTVKGKRNPGDVHIDAGHVTIVGKTKRIRTQNPLPAYLRYASARAKKGVELERKAKTMLDKAIDLDYRSGKATGKEATRLKKEADRLWVKGVALEKRAKAAGRYTQGPIQKLPNPSVTTLSKTFQGQANGDINEYYASDAAPKNLARAGKLVFLKVAGRSLRLPGAMVAIAPNNKLWITGKQALFTTKAKSGEGLDMGEVSHICYETAKAHIEGGKRVEYVHEFGEDGGRRPHLIIDHEGMPILRGGDYTIKAEGIVN